MNEGHLQHMYQAWQQDRDDYPYRWYEFVESVSRHYGVPEDEVMRVLMRCRWFVKGN